MKYDKARGVDMNTIGLVRNLIKPKTQVKDDDYLLILTGPTGSGKSSLTMHLYDLYDDDPSIDFVALSRQEFVRGLKKASTYQGSRFLSYDEADVVRREAMKSWNVDLMKSYAKIRGLNIFHAWCNPSAEWLDKAFIEERVCGLIFIRTKSKDKPRLFYFFTQQNLLDMLEQEGNIKHHTLRSKGSKYKSYTGCFGPYKGKLWSEYLQKKKRAMHDVVDELYEKYAEGERFSMAKVQKALNVSENTALKYAKKAYKEGVLPPNSKTPMGHWALTQSMVEDFRMFLIEQRSRVR